jgi:hypothetical protein
MAEKIIGGSRSFNRKYNNMVDEVNGRRGMPQGDGRISFQGGANGSVPTVSMGQTRKRVANVRASGLAGGIRRAITTEAATANDHITCNLYDNNGVEQTTGDESGIEVYCSIMDGTALNAAVPRLEDNDDLFIVSMPYDNAGTPEQRWYCVSLFNGSEDCS